MERGVSVASELATLAGLFGTLVIGMTGDVAAAAAKVAAVDNTAGMLGKR